MNIFEKSGTDPFVSTIRVPRQFEFAPHGDVPEVCAYDYSGHTPIRTLLKSADRLGPWLTSDHGGEEIPIPSSMNHRALHLRFASIPLEPESILKHAKRLGWLGIRNWIHKKDLSDCREVVRPGYVVTYRPRQLEPVNDWYEEILRVAVLNAMIRIGTATDSKSIDHELKEIDRMADVARAILRPNGNPEADRYDIPGGVPDGIGLHEIGPDRFDEFLYDWRIPRSNAQTYTEIQAHCRQAVQYVVNAELAKRCFPSVQFAPGSPIRLVTKGLLGAIYASMATEINGESGLRRQCAGCSRWFMADHGKKKHCSDSCKTKASRRRQQAKKEESNG